MIVVPCQKHSNQINSGCYGNNQSTTSFVNGLGRRAVRPSQHPALWARSSQQSSRRCRSRVELLFPLKGSSARKRLLQEWAVAEEDAGRDHRGGTEEVVQEATWAKDVERWSGMLPELLHKAVKRVESSGRRWSEVSCDFVFWRWREVEHEVTSVVAELPRETRETTFLASSSSELPVQCYIERNKKTLHSIYTSPWNRAIFMKKGKFLSAVQRFRCNAHVEYNISLDADFLSQGSNAYVGKLRYSGSSPTPSQDFRLVKDLCAHLLDFCILNKKAPLGVQVHSKIVISGLECDSLLGTKLITLYSACRQLQNANTVFDRVPICNAFILNSMIRGYSANGLYQKAINLFHEKMKHGVQPDSYTFSCVLKACASLADLYQGKELHKLASERGLDSDVFVGNSLMCMYTKCRSMENAIKVFEEMPQQDTVSWTSIISAYALSGHNIEAMLKTSLGSLAKCMVIS
ncbi:pentatricopeptide repeat-containing protein [Canna indica]|uniref:Pentatricopeptide repeat-containing protein n=1 Tax=Canna indica TaxID=4628 RepID=A0AAQ3KIJ6_9LILI|nr:pentatricopeptide repeat-containing protein [Canna indica]